MANKNIWC